MTSRSVFLGCLALLALGCGTEDDTRPPHLSYIVPAILAPNCATVSCHSQGTAVSGLDLSRADKAYRCLTSLLIPARSTFPASPRPLVVPFNPDQSRVVRMMRADGADRMPPDRPLAEADIALVEHWIANGAPND